MTFKRLLERTSTLDMYFQAAVIVGMILLGLAMFFFEADRATDELSRVDVYTALFTELHDAAPQSLPEVRYCLHIWDNNVQSDASGEVLEQLGAAGLNVVPLSECVSQPSSGLSHKPTGAPAILLSVDSLVVGPESIEGWGRWYQNGTAAEGYLCSFRAGENDEPLLVSCERQWIS